MPTEGLRLPRHDQVATTFGVHNDVRMVRLKANRPSIYIASEQALEFMPLERSQGA